MFKASFYNSRNPCKLPDVLRVTFHPAMPAPPGFRKVDKCFCPIGHENSIPHSPSLTQTTVAGIWSVRQLMCILSPTLRYCAPCSLAPEVLTDEMFNGIDVCSVVTLAGKSTDHRCARHLMSGSFLTVSNNIPLWINCLRYRPPISRCTMADGALKEPHRPLKGSNFG